MTTNVKVWKCTACGSFVRGINWRECLKGKQYHATPTGGECRAVNFDQVPNPTAEDLTTPSLDSKPADQIETK